MPILIVIAFFERHFKRKERFSQPRPTAQDHTPRHVRKPSMLDNLTNVKSIRLVHAMFEVDQEYRDDISLFAEDRSQWLDSPLPTADGRFVSMQSPTKRRSRVESEPTPVLSEAGGQKGPIGRSRGASLAALGEEPTPGMKEELEDIKGKLGRLEALLLSMAESKTGVQGSG